MEAPDKISYLTGKRLLTFWFVLFLLIIAAIRLLVFFNINLPWIDSDQPFMWAGVKDYAEGKFYEPRFYGQNYNTFMEALFAVPLYRLHVPVYYALPIATHVISLFPFVFTAFYLFFHNKKENALLVLALVICMPTGNDILNSIPRGFVTGLFFTSFFVISLFHPQNRKYILLNTVFAVTGFFVNPNSILVSAPFLFFLFLNNFSNRKYYFIAVLGLLWVIPMYLLFDRFYKLHPSYVSLELEYGLTTAYFSDILKHLDDHFAHISFFLEENCLLLLIILIVLSWSLYRHHKKAFYACLVFFFIVIFSFFSAKTKDGVVWPFYSLSRMYLGIPVFIALMSCILPLRSKHIITLLIVVLGFTSYKLVHFRDSVRYHTEEKRWTGVHLVSLKTVLETADFFQSVCKRNNSDRLLISNGFWACTYLNYGGRVFMEDFPATEETAAERRYTVREGNKDQVFKKFVFLSVNFDFDRCVSERHDFNIRRLDDYGIFLVENNTLKNRDFIALTRACEKK